jgi:hypothetical protein
MPAPDLLLTAEVVRDRLTVDLIEEPTGEVLPLHSDPAELTSVGTGRR